VNRQHIRSTNNSLTSISNGNETSADASDSACLLSWFTYASNSRLSYSGFGREACSGLTPSTPATSAVPCTYTPRTITLDAFITGAEALTTVLCDGVTRVRFKTPITSFSTIVQKYPIYDDLGPPPECKIQASKCDQQYSSFVSGYKSGEYMEELTWWAATYAARTKRDFFGGCTLPTGICTAYDPLTITKKECWVTAKNFALIYWPSSSTSRDFCADEVKTAVIRPNDTPSRGIVMTTDVITMSGVDLLANVWDPMAVGGLVKGDARRTLVYTLLIIRCTKSLQASLRQMSLNGPFTFTSPSVYLAYDTISAENQCGPLGSALYSNIIPLHPSELKSLEWILTANGTTAWDGMKMARAIASNSLNTAILRMGKAQPGAHKIRRPFNLADLEGTVPAAAYYGRSLFDCGLEMSACSTMQEDYYHPEIAMPDAIISLNPAWSSCTAMGWGWDPPIALRPAASIATPAISGLPSLDPSSQPSPQPSPQPVSTLPGPTSSPSSAGPDASRNKEEPYVYPQSTNTPTNPQVISFSAGSLVLIASIAWSSNTRFVVLEGKTLLDGSPPLTVSNQVLRLENSGIIVGSSIVPLPSSQRTPAPVVDFLGHTATISPAYGSSPALIIGSSTLSIGGPSVVIGDHTISLATNGIIVDGSLVSAHTRTVDSSVDGSQDGTSRILDLSTPGPGSVHSKQKSASRSRFRDAIFPELCLSFCPILILCGLFLLVCL
jgi:hypothetical protein